MTVFDAPLDPSAGVQPLPVSDRPLTHRRDWQTVYLNGLLLTDTAIVLAAVGVAQAVRFGSEDVLVASNNITVLNYTGLSILLAVSWLAALSIFRTRSIRIVGSGPEEYRRIFSATIRLFGFIAIISLLAQVDFARLYLAITFPLGLAGLIVSRWGWRRGISRRRKRRQFQTSVLAVGGERAVRELAETFAQGSADGYRVVGVCTPGHTGMRGQAITVAEREIPVLGDASNVIAALEFCGADTVAVTNTEQLGPEGMRELAWAIEPYDVDLVVAPGVMDVAGPRLSMRPVAGLPLVHVEKPQYHGAAKFQKTAFDLVFALFALIVAAPVMLATALAVKFTSRGPVFYKSERVGLDGDTFPMFKFRSMVQDADAMVTQLRDENEADGVLFKIRDDPRVTSVGRFIRKYSIDELPQFINVLRREMSVVGPRPPLPREVDEYDGAVHRRLLVKPGVTGLWQVSGRSDLSWEETVRLDLSYVENWSMTGDILIVAKTAKAVAGSDGAY